ncbi:MAG: OmpA family protein [Lysobacter sp.]|nr:OmpA family protein [Lysobacter sp.]
MLAEAAASWGDLALARSRAASTQSDYDQRRNEIADLRQRLQLGADDAGPAPLTWTEPTVAADADAQTALSQRLIALDADARLQGLASYERLRARQSVDALATVRKSDRPQATQVAQRRVEAAELSAHTEATRRDVDRLDRERSDLLVEASRQEAERARQEAERMRVEAQIQMEEAQRLRASVEAESAARMQAEEIILDVAGDQKSKLSAAREKEAALARQEAELTAGGALPASTRDARGEVFTLDGSSFGSGKSTLTSAAAANVAALGAYIAAAPTGRIRIEAHTDGQGEADANQQLSQRRANAVRDALAAAGVPKSRMQATGMGETAPIADDGTASGRARNRRVEIIVADK